MNGVGLSFVALHAMVHLDFVVAFAAYARQGYKHKRLYVLMPDWMAGLTENRLLFGFAGII